MFWCSVWVLHMEAPVNGGMKESRQVCDTWDAATARKTHISQALPGFSPRLTAVLVPASLFIITVVLLSEELIELLLPYQHVVCKLFVLSQ